MASAQQVSIFLGAGWADQPISPRESSLQDITACCRERARCPKCKSTTSKHCAHRRNWKKFHRPQQKATVNDLTIQQKLSDLLKSKAIPAPKAGTVFCCLSGSGCPNQPWAGCRPALTTLLTTTVNLEAGRKKFTTWWWPFHQNADNHRHGSHQSIFLEAALNPNGEAGSESNFCCWSFGLQGELSLLLFLFVFIFVSAGNAPLSLVRSN